MALTADDREYRETIDTAAEYLGEDVLTDWEQKFVESCLMQIERYGERWIPTERQATTLQQLRDKLITSGLL